MMNRRQFLQSAIAAALATAFPSSPIGLHASESRRKPHAIRQNGITTQIAEPGTALEISKPLGTQEGDLLIGTTADDGGVHMLYKVAGHNEPHSYVFTSIGSPGWTQVPIQYELPDYVCDDGEEVGAIMAFEGLGQDHAIAFGELNIEIWDKPVIYLA